MKELIRTAEAAKLLSVCGKTVTRYCEAGLLRAERERRGVLGRYRWKIEKDSVEELLKRAELAKN